MGLDMYLDRMPRYRGCTARDVSAVENYFGRGNRGKNYKSCSLKEYCGEERIPTQEMLDFYRPYYIRRYEEWDTEKKYGFKTIMETVAQWRKANQIHKWFVDNVQDGEDDCGMHNEVTKWKLEELRSVCQTVMENSTLVPARVQNGFTCDKDGNEIPIYEDGKAIADPSCAESLLPSCSGFFFGSNNYDEYYLEDVVYTITAINKILKETDFDTQMIYYVSSW